MDLGLKIETGELKQRLDFSGWLFKEVDHPRRNSQLDHLLADEHLKKLAENKLSELIAFTGSKKRKGYSYGREYPDQRAFEDAAANHPKVIELWWEFLELHFQKLETGAQRDAEIVLDTLRNCVRIGTSTQFPEIVERLQKIDIAQSLHRSLMAGVLDEYGWEELDQVDDEEKIPASRNYRSDVIESFPTVIIKRKNNADIVAPGSRRRIDCQLEKHEELISVMPVQDDVAVTFQNTQTYDQHIKWLSAPDQKSKPSGSYYYAFHQTTQLELGEGIFFGRRVFAPGDTSIPERSDWYSDGDTVWIHQGPRYFWNEFDADEQKPEPEGLKEIDPHTGKMGRASIPTWFQENLPAQGAILWRECRLRPIPSNSTPLGSQDGLEGWRVVRRRDRQYECRGIDGRECIVDANQFRHAQGEYAVGMIDQPAGESKWIVLDSGEVIDEETGHFIAALRARYCDGTPVILPITYWHLFTLRCPESSQKLRVCKLEEARQLLEAGLVTNEALRKKEDPKNPDPDRKAASKAAETLLPKAPARLLKGVERLAKAAAAETDTLNSLIKRLTDGPKSNGSAEDKLADTKRIKSGLSDLICQPEGCETKFHSYGSAEIEPEQAEQVAKFFNDGIVPESVKTGNLNFLALLDDLPGVVWETFWKKSTVGADKGVSVAERLEGEWLDALQYWANCGLTELDGNLMAFVTPQFDEATAKKLKNANKLAGQRKPCYWVEGKSRYVAFKVHTHYENFSAIIAYHESSEPKPPKGFPIAESFPLRNRWNRQHIKVFVEAVQKATELPLISKEKLEEASEKLGRDPIAIALGWMGNLRTARYGQEKLTKELREHYGWKLKEIKAAISALDATTPLRSTLGQGCFYDPSGCISLRVERAFDRMVNSWKENQKERVTIPAEVIKKLDSLYAYQYGYSFLDMDLINDMLLDPADCSLLKPRNASFEMSKRRHAYTVIATNYSPAMEFNDGQIYPRLLRTVQLLNYELPSGDAVRKLIPSFVKQLWKFLDSPETSFPFGAGRTQQGYDDKKIDKEAILERFKTLVGQLREKEGMHLADSDLVLGAIAPPECVLRFRSAALKSKKEIDLVRALAAITFNYESDGSDQLECLDFVMNAREASIQSFVTSNESSPFPEGSWEQDPRVSVPELVTKVGKKLKVSEEAATLYLQVLALHDPTNTNLKRWNQWTTKTLKAAAEELVTGEHLVRAKRSRASRDFFLPGGWEQLKLPNLPIETWKLPMFGYEDTDRLRGGNAESIICPRTPGDQFEYAWKRVQDGDVPCYQEASI